MIINRKAFLASPTAACGFVGRENDRPCFTRICIRRGDQAEHLLIEATDGWRALRVTLEIDPSDKFIGPVYVRKEEATQAVKRLRSKDEMLHLDPRVAEPGGPVSLWLLGFNGAPVICGYPPRDRMPSIDGLIDRHSKSRTVAVSRATHVGLSCVAKAAGALAHLTDKHTTQDACSVSLSELGAVYWSFRQPIPGVTSVAALATP